ncbi:hypothetical protein ABN034_28620 [Actinopolymorpha sp. B11F2]|uniref:hypothetical protein n=1 Tax=Actinopolymorpha sp. B11F2 TaxID=3160862 RepID=UPI0032E3994E
MRKAPVTLAAFAIALGATFGVAFGAGRLVDPGIDLAADPAGADATPQNGHADMAADSPEDSPEESHAGSPEGTEPGSSKSGEQSVPDGLQVSQDGYSLELLDQPARPRARGELAFRVLGPDGKAVTEFTRAHEADLHLIVVRRDMSGFQHVHPTLDEDGNWTVPFTFPDSGSYRMFADFDPAGAQEALTLGIDVFVPGGFTPRPLPEPARSAAVDGYTVTWKGTPTAGKASRVTLTVSADGRPVTDLQPYLGAYGHLVALRDGDLAYLHVHPVEEADDPGARPGPDITFVVEVPSPGAYRLFLDFRHDDAVRTAEFTVRVPPGGEAPTPSTSEEDDGHGH